MKKSTALLLAVLLFGSLTACGSSAASSTIAPTSTPTATPEPKVEGNLDDIEVSFDTDAATKQAIVYVNNTGSLTFTGNIHVSFKDGSQKQAGYDIIMVEDLAAGNLTYARIKVSSASNLTMECKFADDYTFTEGAPSSGGTLDEALSEALSQNIYDNFGGGISGTPATWYQYIDKIEIFNTDTTSYAVATVNADEQDAVNRIGSMIFANYSKKYSDEYGITKVLVIDHSGTTLFEKE